MFRTAIILTALLTVSVPAFAQTTPTSSLAVEADALAYGISGYSGIFSATLPNKLQLTFGVRRYEAPSFLVSGDVNYDRAQWQATVSSLQVARATYRFRGATKSGRHLAW